MGARSRAVAPALQVGVWACMVMSVMLVVEATYNSAVSVAARLVGWRPERRFKWEPLGGGAGAGDEEKGEAAAAAAAYPMVMVQIPMYNELEVITNQFNKIQIRHKYGRIQMFWILGCRCTSCQSEQFVGSSGQRRG